ncbi:MAG: efflux transporter outer membrane subunit [Pseudomonadota bacterium]
MKLFGIFFYISLLTSCAVGPNYQAPSPKVPDSFTAIENNKKSSIQLDNFGKIQEAWWVEFGDPTLTKLIHTAIHQNMDINMAIQRVLEARASLQQVNSTFFPHIGTHASAHRASVSKNSSSPLVPLAQMGGTGFTLNSFDVGFATDWQLDIFGHITKRNEAATANVGVTREQFHQANLVVISEVASSYFMLRGLQKRLQITQSHILTQEKTLDIVFNKYKTGLVSELDVSQARANLTLSKSKLPNFNAQVKQHIYRLSVLLGYFPTQLEKDLAVFAPLPQLPSKISLGLPKNILINRPDLRTAERSLAKRSAEIGIATAELYPKFSLSALLGLSSLSTNHLFSNDSQTWSLTSGLQWPIFHAGELKAGIRAANTRFNAAYIAYQHAVLIALEDVEGNAVSFNAELNRFHQLRDTLKSAKRSVKLSQILYEKGLAEFLAVLESERSLLEIEDLFIQSNTQRFIKLVSLYKSLGGGWRAFNDHHDATLVSH